MFCTCPEVIAEIVTLGKCLDLHGDTESLTQEVHAEEVEDLTLEVLIAGGHVQGVCTKKDDLLLKAHIQLEGPILGVHIGRENPDPIVHVGLVLKVEVPMHLIHILSPRVMGEIRYLCLVLKVHVLALEVHILILKDLNLVLKVLVLVLEALKLTVNSRKIHSPNQSPDHVQTVQHERVSLVPALDTALQIRWKKSR